ncbi:DUF3347 domain-containing protein [Dyadobacter sp. LHD-138]|uniref:DUF3347 domain-containing protein n=1 Tax=Dyadobacter sp. LHD-138 TaxID=3071413 RepID=UPI0027DF2D7C|nr:DUF3347 domain-containing protein [Dyadobacter sp. LHD-138]MDQ6480579.1 DUF3347 domain-containing protein [Dyadobacter sp. LHD-138]
MKNVTKWAMPVAMIVFLSACGSKNEESNTSSYQDSTAHEHHEGMDMGDKETGKVELKDDKLNAVYQHYIHLTTALINSDVAEAKIASSAIEAGLGQILESSSTSKIASKITEAKDIEEQRGLYSSLSNEFIPMVKKAGLSRGELYVDFCPMANKAKGAYWLSNQKEIKNPYFGDKMISCGEVKETVN